MQKSLNRDPGACRYIQLHTNPSLNYTTVFFTPPTFIFKLRFTAFPPKQNRKKSRISHKYRLNSLKAVKERKGMLCIY